MAAPHPDFKIHTGRKSGRHTSAPDRSVFVLSAKNRVFGTPHALCRKRAKYQSASQRRTDKPYSPLLVIRCLYQEPLVLIITCMEFMLGGCP